MPGELTCRIMKHGEEVDVVDLVRRVFEDDIGPLYTQEGIREFLSYVRAEFLAHRSQSNHFVLVAADKGEIVGMIEVRDCTHICLLFVDNRHRQRGIARALIAQSIQICRARRPELREITVNSSPNSVGIYRHLGFHTTGPETTVHGIRFTPMILPV